MASPAAFMSGATAGPIPARSFRVYIPNGATTVAVADTRVSSTSLIVPELATDGAAKVDGVAITPGVGFSVNTNAPVAAAAPGLACQIQIVRY